MRVPCRSFAGVLRDARLAPGRVVALAIDAEGHDEAIVSSLELCDGALAPALVVYEHAHLDGVARARARRHLADAGYACLGHAGNTWCVRGPWATPFCNGTRAPSGGAADRDWSRPRALAAT